MPGTDFLLFGPAGVLVVENRLEAGGKTRTLRTVETSALSEKTKGAESVVTVDLDHDGALDLVVARKGTGTSSAPHPGAISVWRNLGRRQFADVTPRSGLVQAPLTARSLAAVDWNHDFDMDVLLAGGGPSPAGVGFLQGAGEGRFRLQPLAPHDPVFQTAMVLAVLDADANGSCDVLAAGPAGMALLRTSSTQPGEVNTWPTEAVSDFPASDLLVLDYDNDGCQDVIGWNGEAVRCFHGVGDGRFESATDVLPASLKAILSADCGDIDGDGDIDLLVVASEGGGGRLHLLRNEGGNANNWIDVPPLRRVRRRGTLEGKQVLRRRNRIDASAQSGCRLPVASRVRSRDALRYRQVGIGRRPSNRLADGHPGRRLGARQEPGCPCQPSATRLALTAGAAILVVWHGRVLRPCLCHRRGGMDTGSPPLADPCHPNT